MAVDRKAITEPVDVRRPAPAKSGSRPGLAEGIMRPSERKAPPAFVLSTSVGSIAVRTIERDGCKPTAVFAGMVVRGLERHENAPKGSFIEASAGRYLIRNASADEIRTLREELGDLGRFWFKEIKG